MSSQAEMGVAQSPGRMGEPDVESGLRHGLSERVYAGLLRAYPREFRHRYRDEMVVLFRDQLRDARAARRSGGAALTWVRTLLDLVSSALGEHLRRDRVVGQSLSTFQPTISMRLLGLFGIVGALLLLAAYGAVGWFIDPGVNRIRIVWFALAGAAISLAFYRRAAPAAPILTLLTTAAVVFAGLWTTLWVIASPGMDRPFVGALGLISLFAGIALWVAPAAWSIGLLHTGAAWRGMTTTRRVVTKLGLAALICSCVGWIGDDRLGMVDSLWGEMWGAIALASVALSGVGWAILGLVLVIPAPDHTTEA